MTIDVHAHLVPPVVAEALRQRTSVPRIANTVEGGERLDMPRGSLAFGSAFTAVAERIEFMDRLGVTQQLLSLPGLFGVDSLPAAESTPLLKAANDAYASACRAYPNRFLGLAALPMADTGGAAAELHRAVAELGLIGAILPASAFVSHAEAMKVCPILAAADELGAHIFIHPGPLPDQRRDDAAPQAFGDNLVHRHSTLDVQATLSQVMVTLMLTDLLDAYPNVTVQVANLGGMIPFVLERMDHVVQIRSPGGVLPSTRVRRVWTDCASLGPRALALAVEVYGADRVLFGTDCPIFRTDFAQRAVCGAGLAVADQARILRDNAQALFSRFR